MTGSAELPASPMLPGALRGMGWPESHTVFVITRDGREASWQHRLAARFGLSGAETRIALLLAEGLTTAQIAEARQARVHTVRNQIRTILHKMEARHRSDVVREILKAQAHRDI